MSDPINNLSHPRLHIPSLFDETHLPRMVPQKVENAPDQFRFTTESSLEGFYKKPKQNVIQEDIKVIKSETQTEIWFG